MILRYRYLRQHPAAFFKLTGMELTQFDDLLDTVFPCYIEAERQRRNRPERQRAVGGGDHADLDICNQVLLVLIWLRLYPKQQVLADFFGISQPTAWRYIQRVTPVLRRSGIEFTIQPDPGRKRRRNLAALLCDVPELLPLISEAIRVTGRNARSRM